VIASAPARNRPSPAPSGETAFGSEYQGVSGDEGSSSCSGHSWQGWDGPPSGFGVTQTPITFPAPSVPTATSLTSPGMTMVELVVSGT